MTTRVLIVPADSTSLGKARRRLSGKKFSWAYLGQSLGQLERAKICLDSGSHLDTAPKFHKAAQDLRGPFLTYLYDIGRNLNSLLWWVTSLSYRSGYVSRTFVQACQLKVGLDIIRDWKGPGLLALIVAERPVGLALAQNAAQSAETQVEFVGSRKVRVSALMPPLVILLARRAYFALREGRRIVLARWLVRRAYFPSEPTTLLVSTVSRRSIGRGEDFHSFFFGDLASKIEKLGERVALMPLVLPEVPYHKGLSAVAGSPFPLCVPHRYLKLSDLVRSIIRTIRPTPQPRPFPKLEDMDISPLVEDDLRVHWISNRAADNLLLAAAIRRLGDSGAKVNRIIYVYENQPWERALCWQSRRSLPQAKLVGYQHSRAPHMLLNFYLAPGGEKEAPLPDRIMTVGKYTARMLTSEGYQPGQVRLGGVFQMRERIAPGPRENGSAPELAGNTVLIAPSVGREEAGELVGLALKLYDENAGVRIIIKCHPMLPFDGIIGGNAQRLPSHVEVSEKSIGDLMAQSSVMVYTDSAVCIQALAAELPAIHLRPSLDLDMDPLEGAPHARLEATGLEELRKHVEAVLQHREEYISQHRQVWKQLVEDMFTPATEETYRAFIDA